jgi:alpha-methylacyl-CoA racemase
MTPPLPGIRAVEFGGIGPRPLVGRMLAGMVAEVAVIEQFNGFGENSMRVGKQLVQLDLKLPIAPTT